MTIPTRPKTDIYVGTTSDGLTTIDPMHGSGLIAGTPQTGKTTLLRHLTTGAVKAGAEVHVFDLLNTPGDYAGIDTATTCTGNNPTAITKAIDVLSTAVETTQKRYQLMRQRSQNWANEAPILIVVDESQHWFDSKQSDTLNQLVEQLTKKGRAAGISIWISTANPNKKTIPKSIQQTVAYRVGFNLPNPTKNDFVLGHGSHQNGIDTTKLPAHQAWIIPPADNPTLTHIDN